VNVEGTRILLDAMREAGVDTMVFSSSAAVYGAPARIPIAEDAPIAPLSPYGRNKADVELLLREAAAAWGLRNVSLRYFNAAGADPEARIGEWHAPETHLIPLVLDAAAGVRESIRVFGTDYETRDGTCVRDYIHVCDLAEAHVLALGYAQSGESGAFNLGTGGGASVLEVIESARAVTGLDIPVQADDRRAGDPPTLVADSARAAAVLGWEPKRQTLATVVEDAWRWYGRLHADGGVR
jgi:UDP-glucose-4-epimerase GalE